MKMLQNAACGSLGLVAAVAVTLAVSLPAAAAAAEAITFFGSLMTIGALPSPSASCGGAPQVVNKNEPPT